jgi:hypothetical protein
MGDLERIDKVEQKIDNHLKDSAEKDVALYSAITKMSTKLENIEAMFKDFSENHVHKNEIPGIIATEREKSDNRYLKIENTQHVWEDCYEMHTDKRLDSFAKKVKIWGFFQALIASIISFIIGVIVKSNMAFTWIK